jgi:hypothetical protein
MLFLEMEMWGSKRAHRVPLKSFLNDPSICSQFFNVFSFLDE